MPPNQRRHLSTSPLGSLIKANNFSHYYKTNIVTDFKSQSTVLQPSYNSKNKLENDKKKVNSVSYD